MNLLNNAICAQNVVKLKDTKIVLYLTNSQNQLRSGKAANFAFAYDYYF
jgi:hypothetical protein